jgi:hypothetical protein
VIGGKGGFLFAAGPTPGAEKLFVDWIDCKKSARIGQTNNSWRSNDPSSDAGAAQAGCSVLRLSLCRCQSILQ